MKAQKKVSITDFWSGKFSAGGLPVTKAVCQKLGAITAWLACKSGMTPNQVTLLAGVASILGAVLYTQATHSHLTLIAAFVTLQLGYILDCSDGQLARATERTSNKGMWLDVYFDFATIISLGMSVCYTLIQESVISHSLIILATGLYIFARVGDLFSCTVLRNHNTTSDNQAADSEQSLPRILFLTGIDTPVVLAIICFLRYKSEWLAISMYFLGGLFIIHTIYIMIKRDIDDSV